MLKSVYACLLGNETDGKVNTALLKISTHDVIAHLKTLIASGFQRMMHIRL